jgi:hypothetical protein
MHQANKQSNKIVEIGIIIVQSFILAFSIFVLIVYWSFFYGGNQGPIVGVILGSIASLAFFVFFLVAWILRAQGFTIMRAYSIAFAVVCLIPVIYSAVAFTIHLIR